MITTEQIGAEMQGDDIDSRREAARLYYFGTQETD